MITLTSQVEEFPKELGIKSIERMKKKGTQYYVMHIERVGDSNNSETVEQPEKLQKILFQLKNSSRNQNNSYPSGHSITASLSKTKPNL